MLLNEVSISRKLAKQFKVPRWLLHVLYWIIWVVFWGIMWGTFDNNYVKTFYIQVIELPFKLMLVYLVIYLLMPRYFYQGKYITFLVSYIFLLLTLGLVLKIISYFTIDPIYFTDRLSYGIIKFTELMNVMLTLNTAMVIPFGIKLTEFWMYHQQKNTALERDKLQAELKFLRTQVNPHFLFNALNSLYALSLKHSEYTSDTISRLSDIMRYIIYEAAEPLVDFKKEQAFIENYIEFEKVRLSQDAEISFSVMGKRTGKIPPLLFIPLIENAFKHLKSYGGEKPWIVIQLEVTDKLVKLFVENSFTPQTTPGKTKGIGLENLKHRLKILYPENYQLLFEQNNYSYKSVLKINEKAT